MVGLIAAMAFAAPEESSAPGTQDADQPTTEPERRPSRPRWKLALRVLAVGAAGYVAVVIAVVAMEDRFVYQPTAGSAVGWKPAHLGVEEVRLRTADGVQLYGWWRPPGSDEAPVLLWCHGNAGNISHRAENLELLGRRGLGVLLFDYRGYGRSEGSPSEEGLYLDAEAAHRYLTEEQGIAPRHIILFGRSLGAAVALRTVLERPAAGLIMESPFVNVPAMARHMMPFLPVWALARNEFDSLARIGRLEVPVLIIHGTADRLVPPEQGRRLYQAAPEPKEWYAIEGAGHNDTYMAGGEQYMERFDAFCRRCVRPQFE